MKSILDRSFKYVPSHETDIRRTFERAREIARQAQQSVAVKVLPLNAPRKAAQ
jgi:hypothetical protein